MKRTIILILSAVAITSLGYAGQQDKLKNDIPPALAGQSGFMEDGVTGTRCEPPGTDNTFVVWPVSGTPSPDLVVSPYGPRALGSNYDFHAGIDIPPTIPEQTVVRAVMDGKVVRKYRSDEQIPTCRFGNWVMVRHADSLAGVRRYTTYLHLATFLVNLGDTVQAGQPIGVMGRTGCNINTEHLHFEFYENLNTVCGVFLELSRSPYGLPLPIEDQRAYDVRLGRVTDTGSVILRAEIPSGKLDVVEYKVINDKTSYRVDLNEKVGIAGRPCTKCCDKAVTDDGHVIQLMPKRFAGDQNYVLCISIDNADVRSTYMATLRNTQDEEFAFGPFSPNDPADLRDCVSSEAPGCPTVEVCQSCREQE